MIALVTNLAVEAEKIVNMYKEIEDTSEDDTLLLDSKEALVIGISKCEGVVVSDKAFDKINYLQRYMVDTLYIAGRIQE